MSSRDTVTEWLKEISGGEENFEYRDDGLYTYEVLGGIKVTIEIPDIADVFYLHSAVSALPEEETSGDFYAKILRMNLLNVRTRGATFGLDDRSRRIVLAYASPVAGMDVIGFINLLDGFIETAREMRQELRSAELNSATFTTEDEPQSPGNWLKA